MHQEFTDKLTWYFKALYADLFCNKLELNPSLSSVNDIHKLKVWSVQLLRAVHYSQSQDSYPEVKIDRKNLLFIQKVRGTAQFLTNNIPLY